MVRSRPLPRAPESLLSRTQHKGLTVPMYLTIGEVAARLRVRPRTVRWLIRRQQLIALRVDREFLIEKSDLAAFIDAHIIRAHP